MVAGLTHPRRLQWENCCRIEGHRRGGRVVEGTGLENRQRGDPFVGSNPTLSAILLRATALHTGWSQQL